MVFRFINILLLQLLKSPSPLNHPSYSSWDILQFVPLNEKGLEQEATVYMLSVSI